MLSIQVTRILLITQRSTRGKRKFSQLHSARIGYTTSPLKSGHTADSFLSQKTALPVLRDSTHAIPQVWPSPQTMFASVIKWTKSAPYRSRIVATSAFVDKLSLISTATVVVSTYGSCSRSTRSQYPDAKKVRPVWATEQRSGRASLV